MKNNVVIRKGWLILLLAFAILMLAGRVRGADIKVVENPVPLNSFAEVRVEGLMKGDDVAWDVSPDPVKVVDKGNDGLYFSGPPGTKYRVMADIINFDTKKRTRVRKDVTMGDGGDVVPPDDPPDMATTAFQTTIKNTFAGEQDPGKLAQAVKFKALYTKAVSLLDTAATWGDLVKAIGEEAVKQDLAGKLPLIQGEIDKYLMTQIPSKGTAKTPIDPAGKKKAKSAFTAVVTALGKLK